MHHYGRVTVRVADRPRRCLAANEAFDLRSRVTGAQASALSGATSAAGRPAAAVEWASSGLLEDLMATNESSCACLPLGWRHRCWKQAEKPSADILEEFLGKLEGPLLCLRQG